MSPPLITGHISSGVKDLDDVEVLDSEPEREEFRRKLKEERKQKKRESSRKQLVAPASSITTRACLSPLSPVLISTHPRQSNDDVIEISDNDEEPATVQSSKISAHSKLVNASNEASEEPSIIDISDDSRHPPAPVSVLIQATQQANDRRLPTPVNSSPSTAAVDIANREPAAAPEEHQDSDDSEQEGFRLKMGRFACTSDSQSSSRGSRPPARTYHSYSTAASPTPVSDAPPVEKKKRARTPKVQLDLGTTDSELASLKQCIACKRDWTVRKTAVQKGSHIRTCAAKHALNQETVIILIRRALDESPPPPKTKGKAKAKTVEEPAAEPKTYLENVIDETTAKRRGRRPEVQSTVQDVRHTTTAILNRARTVLDVSVDKDGPAPPLTQAFGKSKLGSALRRQEGREQEENAEPPRTQVFGKSALGARSGSGAPRISGFGSTSDVEDDGPPLTQPFAPSKLGASLLATGSSLMAPLSPSRQSNQDKSVISISSSPDSEPALASSARDRALPRTQASKQKRGSFSDATGMVAADVDVGEAMANEEYVMNDDLYGWQWDGGEGFNDDANLYFEPDLQPGSPVAGPSRTTLERAALSMDEEPKIDEDSDSSLPLLRTILAPSGSGAKDKGKRKANLPDTSLGKTKTKPTKKTKPSAQGTRPASPPPSLSKTGTPKKQVRKAAPAPSPPKSSRSQQGRTRPTVLHSSDEEFDLAPMASQKGAGTVTPKRRKRQSSSTDEAVPKSKATGSPSKKAKGKAKATPSTGTRTRKKRTAASDDEAGSEDVEMPVPGRLVLDDDEAARYLEEKLKASIFADEELHLRILRYEPIQFDVFIQLLKDVKMGKGRMKVAVSGILDKLAINFHGVDGTTGRSRTKKR